MGVGKTPTVIEAIRQLALRRVLIICPAIARVNWLREWERFAPELPPPALLLSYADPVPLAGGAICSYDYARECAADLYIAGPWQALVLDEFHMLRGVDADRTLAILGSQGLVRRTRRLWALTGTPIANHVGDLWGLLRVAGLTALGYEAFTRRYCTGYLMGHRWRITGTNTKTLPEITGLLHDSGIMLRRMKEDVMQGLPPLTYERTTVPASEVDMDLYFPAWSTGPEGSIQKLKERIEYQRSLIWAILQDAGADKAPTWQEALTAVKSLANSISELRMYTGLQKMPAVGDQIAMELLDRCYPKILILAWHQAVIEGLAQRLRKFGSVQLYGGTSAHKRQANIDRFNNDPKCRVFVGQVLACGTAINLTAKGECHQVALVEQSYVPGENAQAVLRCHRMGATKPVHVRTFQLDDPIDRRLTEILERKTAQISLLLGERRETVTGSAAPFTRVDDPINS